MVAACSQPTKSWDPQYQKLRLSSARRLQHISFLNFQLSFPTEFHDIIISQYWRSGFPSIESSDQLCSGALHLLLFPSSMAFVSSLSSFPVPALRAFLSFNHKNGVCGTEITESGRSFFVVQIEVSWYRGYCARARIDSLLLYLRHIAT